MPDDVLATLQAVDPAVLEGVVREDQRSPSFQITDWSVRCLSDKGIINPNGLWLFSGQGRARQVGRWNGACAMTPDLRDEPWFVRQQYRSWLGWIDNEAAWHFPPHKNHLSTGYRARHDQLWAEREWLYGVIERLPQVFSHQDCQRRNLFTRRGEDRHDELVAIDWAQCGLGPLGAELNHLVGMSALLLEWPPARVRELEAVAFENYLEGLREAGWLGNPEMIRLGFVAYLAAFVGCALPGATAWWCSVDNRQSALDQFGASEEELFWQWLPLYDYALDCADEARQLVTKLGV